MRYQVTLFFSLQLLLASTSSTFSSIKQIHSGTISSINVIRINNKPVCAIFGDCYRYSQAVIGEGPSPSFAGPSYQRSWVCLFSHFLFQSLDYLPQTYSTLSLQEKNKMGLTKEYLERPHQGISAMWGRYLESGEYSDFLVTCANREFHVHRLVICPRSSYFRLMCKDNFKEGITQKLELVDEDPDVFQSVLTFLYTGIYETCKITGSEEIGNSILSDVCIYVCF